MPVEIDENIKQFPRTKKESYKNVKGMDLIPETLDKFPEGKSEQRKSERTVNHPERLTYYTNNWKKSIPVLMSDIGFGIFKNHYEHQDIEGLNNKYKDFKPDKRMVPKHEMTSESLVTILV